MRTGSHQIKLNVGVFTPSSNESLRVGVIPRIIFTNESNQKIFGSEPTMDVAVAIALAFPHAAHPQVYQAKKNS